VQCVGVDGIIILVNICVSDLFSMRKRGIYFGIMGIVWAFAGGVGPIVGGAFTSRVSWRWCFYINLPISGLGFAILVFVLKLHNRDHVTLKLAKNGEGPVTAADIEPNHDVEIINPEHLIAHLTAGGKIEMEIKVEKGRGYQPATVRIKPDGGRSIGNILLDASFSPVRRVSYSVESARVEQRTDLDKLVMDIETNGVLEPEHALRYPARILAEPLGVFADLKGTAAPTEQRSIPPTASRSRPCDGVVSSSRPPGASTRAMALIARAHCYARHLALYTCLPNYR